MGVQITLNVSWPATALKQASSGNQVVKLWTLSTLTLSGTALSGMTHACGTTLPDLMTTAIAGKNDMPEKIGLTFPDAIWDKPTMPKYAVTGTQSGTTMGSTISFEPQVLLLGLEPGTPAVPDSVVMASTAWPPNTPYPEFMSNQLSDDDGDTYPGITLVPATSSGYSLPPTGAINSSETGASAVYIVSRNEASISGMLTSATEASGSATVQLFENHVVGCADSSSATVKNCSTAASAAAGPEFVDTQRPVYTPGTATFKSTTNLSAGALCADVRTALP
jgi:hypothetical protein